MVLEVHVPGVLAGSNGVLLIALWESSMRLFGVIWGIFPTKSSCCAENPIEDNLSNHWLEGFLKIFLGKLIII